MDLVRSCNKAVTQTSKRSLGGMVVGYSVSCNAEMVGVAADIWKRLVSQPPGDQCSGGDVVGWFSVEGRSGMLLNQESRVAESSIKPDCRRCEVR